MGRNELCARLGRGWGLNIPLCAASGRCGAALGMDSDFRLVRVAFARPSAETALRAGFSRPALYNLFGRKMLRRVK